jgi:hypothetical protein
MKKVHGVLLFLIFLDAFQHLMMVWKKQLMGRSKL